MSRHTRLALVFVSLAALLLASWGQTASGAPVHKPTQAVPLKVAFLYPESFTGRWVRDAAYFALKLSQLDPTVQVIISNANANANLQSSQADIAMSSGAKVLVLAAVDGVLAAPIVNRAAARGVKVIAYDRAIQSAQLRWYDSFDGVAVGRAQGSWLVSHVKQGGTIVVINGSLTDDNAHLFNTGYESFLAPKLKSGYFKDGGQYWTPNWVPATAGTEMENALTKDSNNVQGVLSANDGMAGPIIAALKRVNLAGIPVTGQDAQPDALGRILAGTQGMTVYKPLYEEANSAAVAANALVHGRPVTNFKQMYHTHKGAVHAVLFKPIVITKANIARVVKDGFATWAQICAGIPASACVH